VTGHRAPRRRRAAIAWLLAVTLLAIRARSLAQPLGAEFRVNDYTSGPQTAPSVAVNGTGDFLVVFRGEGADGAGIYARLYDQAGSPKAGQFRVDTTASAVLATPAVASNGSEGFLAVWSTGTEIRGRGISPNGPIQQADFFISNDDTLMKLTPAVASDATGQFLVAWSSYPQDGDSSGVYGQRLDAYGNYLGSEFRVNTTTSGGQAAPKVAASADAGGFVVVWQSYGPGQDGSGYGIFGQRYAASGAPIGGELRVNTITTGQQTAAAVAMDAAGDFVVVWSSDVLGQYAVQSQRFSASGSRVGSEFRVDTFANQGLAYPSIATEPGGGFVVAWQELSDAGAYGIVGRRFDASGTPLESPFRINTYTTGNQISAVIAPDAAGNLVVVWQGPGQGDAAGIFAARATPPNGDVRVNTYTTGYQGSPAVSADAIGNLVIVWESSGQDGSTFGVHGQRMNDVGVPDGAEFRVDTATTGSQILPRIASSPSGSFVVVWTSFANSALEVRAQRYASSGAPLGTEFRVNTTTGPAGFADVSSNSSGGFVVAWGDGSGGSSNLLARRFSASGVPLGAEIQVNQVPLAESALCSIASDSAGNFVVVWQSYGDDGSLGAILGRRYTSSGVPLAGPFLVNTTTTGDQYLPSVARTPRGEFAVVWESAPGTGHGVLGRVYNASGAPFGPEFLVDAGSSDQRFPHVAFESTGGFVVSWTSYGEDGSGKGVFARRFSAATLDADGPAFRVNGFTPGAQVALGAASGPGRFAVVWRGGGEGSDYGVFLRRLVFLANGDVNGDGVVSVGDVFYLINYLFAAGPAPAGPGDVDGNGKLDVADVFYLINFLFAGGPAPN
jgi:hypothetical protein